MIRLLLPAVLALALGAGPAAGAEPQPQTTPMPQLEAAPYGEFISPQDSLPHLRFLADGKTSLNDRCPVRRVRLNPKMGAAYINDQPVGFC